MPGRRSELRPLKRGGFLSLLCGLCVELGMASPATAQVAGPSVRISAAVELAATPILDEWMPQAGAAVLFDLAPWIQIGGVGRIGLDHPTVLAPAELQVRFGYGGVRVGVRPAVERLPGLLVTLLAGAGNVDVQDPALGRVEDSENGGVLEPGVAFTRPLAARVGLLASAGWRFAFEFEPLVGVDASDLAGPSLGIGVVIGPF